MADSRKNPTPGDQPGETGGWLTRFLKDGEWVQVGDVTLVLTKAPGRRPRLAIRAPRDIPVTFLGDK